VVYVQQGTLGAKTLEELPQAARDYISKIEQVVGAPVDIISTGPDRVETIQICTGYACKDGNPAPNPVDSDDYENLVPQYEEVPGWSESTLGAKTLEELPQAARDYITKIEQVVGAPVDIISTGPDRVETIVLRHPFEA
jgi:adenylosuccinate synthase